MAAAAWISSTIVVRIVFHPVFQSVINFRPLRVVETVECAYKILMDCSLPSCGCRVQSLHSVSNIIIVYMRAVFFELATYMLWL